MDESIRFICYGVGLVFCLVMFTQFWRQGQTLARLLALLFAIWAVNCLVLGSGLAVYIVTGQVISWAFTINAVLLAFGPLSIWVWYLRQNGRDAG